MKPCIIFFTLATMLLVADAARADTIITTFDNFVSDALYPSWSLPSSTIVSGPTSYSITATGYGSNYKYIEDPSRQGAGNTLLELTTTLSGPPAADGHLGPIITLIDTDGSRYNYAWYAQLLGPHVLTMPVDSPTWIDAPGGSPGLNLNGLQHMHMQLDPGGFGTAGAYTVEWQHLQLIAREKTWGVEAGGLFSEGSNWVGGVAPTGASESVAFTTAITADRTIDVDVAASLISLHFDDDNNYTLAGTGPIRFQAAGPAVANLTVQNTHGDGAHTINTPIEILGDLVITQDSTQPLTIGGPLDAAPTRSITKAGAGTVIASRVRAAALTVNAGSLVIAPNGGEPGTSVVDVLDVSGTSRLDLNNNDLVVRASAATKDAVHDAIQDDIASAQNGVDGNFITNWNGPGITSSAARNANLASNFDLVGLGAIRNSDIDILTGLPGSSYSTFSGQAVTPDDVLVKYTYIGDGNLDGLVSFDDYVGMDNAFFGLIPNLGWATGDINFDGAINFDDYSVVDQAFFFQGAP